MYEETELWYAVFDEEAYSEFPVTAGSEKQEDSILGHLIVTYELHEDSAADGTGYIATVKGPMMEGEDFRVVAKTRKGAFAGMVAALDERAM